MITVELTEGERTRLLDIIAQVLGPKPPHFFRSTAQIAELTSVKYKLLREVAE